MAAKKETPAESDVTLKAAADAANQSAGAQGGMATHFSLPERRPYEPKATKKQKDFLWALGVQDQTFLKALGKWQAVAMIDQIKAKDRKEGNAAFLKMALILGAVVAVIFLLVKFIG